MEEKQIKASLSAVKCRFGEIRAWRADSEGLFVLINNEKKEIAHGDYFVLIDRVKSRIIPKIIFEDLFF